MFGRTKSNPNATDTLPSQPTMTFDRAYRAAIALNNVAVDLLEKQCDMQALETFQDALALMKILTSKKNSEDLSHVSAVEQKVRKASERVSKPTRLKRNRPGMTFTVLSDDDDCRAAMDGISYGESPSGKTAAHPSATHALLIRIEVYGTEGISPSQRDADLDSAIILQNFGLSYLSASSAAISRAVRHILRQSAVRLLQLAQTIVANRASDSSDEGNDVVEKLFIVSLVSTKSMSQAFMAMGNGNDLERKVKQCFEHLNNLETAIRQLGFDFTSVHNKMVAAAA